MVQRFVTELLSLPNKCSVKKTHVNNFIDILDQKAKTMLSYVEANRWVSCLSGLLIIHFLLLILCGLLLISQKFILDILRLNLTQPSG